MSRDVNAIAGRLSLRAPQRRSLEILDRIELDTYARASGQASVKPFVLVIARETTHAGKLMALIQSDPFFDGRYKTKVIQVDSSRSGAEEDEMVQRLLRVESPDEPTEIVIHVNMLKEGWDVTNLYTIVPLRPAHARTLIEQSIGRGLRLPYGRRTGVAAVDTLNIVAHDKFQEIVDEAGRPGSLIQMKALILDPGALARRPVTVVSPSILESKLGVSAQTTADTTVAGGDAKRAFDNPREQEVAQVVHSVIRSLEVKMKSEMDSLEVRAKKQAAVTWCGYASDHATTCGGKPWRYGLIAHDVITENMSLASLVGSPREAPPKV